MALLISKDFLGLTEKETSGLNHDSLRILILEDLETDAEIIIHTLLKNGLKFESHRVDTFNDFVKSLNDFKPTLILADYSLPSFSSIEALKYIKKNKINLPFIFVTPSQSEEVAVQCLKEGADDYILKPNLVRLITAINNSVQRRRLEQQKSAAEARTAHYKELYEIFLEAQSNADTCFLVIDSLTEQPNYVNESFCNLCGYKADEILYLSSILEIIKPEEKENFQARITETIKNKNTAKTFVTDIVHKEGHIINTEFTARQITRKNKTYLVLIGRDITLKRKNELMQKLIQETLIESEKKFRTLIEDVKDYAIFMLNVEGEVFSWNVGAERLLGYSESEIILKDFKIFSPIDNYKKSDADDLLKQARKSGRIEKELWLVRKNNQAFWAALTITVILNKDFKLNYYSVIIHDLTKIKKAEDQLKEHEIQLRSLASHLQAAREEERTRIARELHDEFSQMLTALRMDLTILGRMISKSVTDSLNRISLLEKISSISDLMETIIRSTRRIITELRPAVLDELGLLTAIQWLAQEFESRTGVRCKIARLQHNISIDKDKSTAIFRVLQEALTNVSKHSKANYVTISLYIQDNFLKLEISDNGQGLQEDKLKDPTSSGILGIRERIIALGGEFDIKSEKGNGTELIISIPYQEQ